MADKKLSYKDIWETLSKVDVSEHTEKKMNLTYLSWAWAWGVLMEHYPEAIYSFYEDENHVPFVSMPDGTCEVRCKVVIGELVREMWLPVMNHSNKPVINPNSFQVNTSKMRCLTKCLGMWGLGHYIYSGEDLPQGAEAKEEKPVGKKPEPVKEEAPVEKEQVKDEAWAKAFVEGFVKFLVVCKTEEEIKGLYKANGDINILKEKFPEEKTRLDAFVIQHKEKITNTSEGV
jgi:hypothetical protein